MQLRNHPKILLQWPPKRSSSFASTYAGADPLQLPSEIPEAAILRGVKDCPPLSPSNKIQWLTLITDQGEGTERDTARIITTDYPIFHQHLLQTLQVSLGMSLREIGDLKIDF